jgi:hypothetical protein
MSFIRNTTEIRQLANQFFESISPGCREFPDVSFNYRTRSGEDRPRTTGFQFPDGDVWFLYLPQWYPEPSFIFGKGIPSVGARATVEVNLYERCNGVFAYDHGRLLLTHKGRMGGGRSGITKEGVLNALEDIVVTIDGTRVLRVAEIGNNEAQMRAQIVEFLNGCERAKEELAGRGRI